MQNREERYIRKRKRKAFFHSLVYRLCQIFPVDPHKVVMWTFEGKGGYGCSPKYIAEELLKQNQDGKKKYKIVWLVNDVDKQFPDEIKKVKSTLWSRAYHLSTAGFWVSNTRTFYGTKKRKGTTYIQTWHGTLNIKPIGKQRGNALPKMAEIVSAYDSAMIDYVLSGSHWCTETWRDGLLYGGKILETGTPRCDILFHGIQQKHMHLREEYNIPADAKILLYAPTFRGGSQSTNRSVNAEVSSLDFRGVIDALEKRFGGKWYVFLRLHPQLAAQMAGMPVNEVSERLIDVSQRPDMNEIIAASDAFITDYSSAIFESMLTKQPSFIYADDLQEYVADRGELMFDMKEMPFPVAFDNAGLMEKIARFDETTYSQSVERFIEKTGIVEDGHAVRRIVEIIKNGEAVEIRS